MNIVRDVFEELFSMFAGDRRLAIGIAIVVILAAVVARMAQPASAGVVLFAGSVMVLLYSILYAPRSQ